MTGRNSQAPSFCSVNVPLTCLDHRQKWRIQLYLEGYTQAVIQNKHNWKQ